MIAEPQSEDNEPSRARGGASRQHAAHDRKCPREWSPRDYLAGHPSRAVLLVEVADASLVFDREHEGRLHARAHVPDYWIVNLVDRVLEVHRDPAPSADAPYGWRFSTRRRLGATDGVSPPAAPRARILVVDLLP
jgi:Putative restriction endonuclease